MQFLTPTVLAFGAFAASANAQLFATVFNFQGSGCTGASEGDAVFGSPNLCQPLDTTLPLVKSFKLLTAEENCTVHYFTDSKCTQGETIGVVNHCEEANFPFVAVNVECPV